MGSLRLTTPVGGGGGGGDATKPNAVRVCFDRLDSDGDGKVNKATMKEVLRALNRPYTETELGNFPGDEFDYYAVANFANSRNFQRQAVLEAFRGLTGGALTVNADLLKFWLTTMGEELTDEELDAVFNTMEISPGGIFSVEVFVDILESLSKKLHDSAVPAGPGGAAASPTAATRLSIASLP